MKKQIAYIITSITLIILFFQEKIMQQIQLSTILLTIVMCTTIYAMPAKIDIKYASEVNTEHYILNKPSELIVDNERQRSYVISKENYCIFVIDMSSQQPSQHPYFIQKIKLPCWNQPDYKSLTLDSKKNCLYLLDESSQYLYMIDLNTCNNDDSNCYSSIEIDRYPSIATLVDNKKLYIAHAIGKLTVVGTDEKKVIESFIIDQNFIPEHMTHYSNKLYITGLLYENSKYVEKLFIVDINPLSSIYGSVIKIIDIQGYSSDMIYDRDLSRIYISHSTGQGHISIIDVNTDSLITTLCILPKTDENVPAKESRAMTIQDGMVYIVNKGDNSFTIMNPQTFDLITPEHYHVEGADPIGIKSLNDTNQLIVLLQPGRIFLFDILKFYSLAINTTGQATGIVTSSPVGIDCGKKCEAIFQENEIINLSAEASGSYSFSGWHKACENEELCTFSIKDNMEIEAIFKPLKNQIYKAIIIAGGGPQQIEYTWNAIKYITGFAYKVLLDIGYEKQDIRFFCDDFSTDFDFNGKYDDIYSSPNLDDIQNTIVSWADDATDLLLVMVGHGDDSIFYLHPDEYGELHANELNGWLNSFQAKTKARLIVVYDGCESGSFIPKLVFQGINHPKRIVITSADKNENAITLYINGHHSFAVHFFSNVYYGSNVYDSFSNSQKIMDSIESQTPQLNGDNDSNANEKNDYEETNKDFIRTGEPNTGNYPLIQNVNDPIILHDTNAGTIQAKGISDQDGISKVYAMILSPFFYKISAPDLGRHFSTIDLIDYNQDGSYTGVYQNFIFNGTYEVLVYAVDSLGFSSLPSKTTAIQKNGIIPSPGDVNIDLTINLKDTILMLQALVDQAVRINPDIFDANQNQHVGIEDAILVLKKSGKFNN